jgi:hypothetical protein
MSDRKERYKKRAVNTRIKKATDEHIENIEAAEIYPTDIKLTVPFRLATKLNQEVSLRKSQNNIRKQMSTFIENHFDDFVKDYNRITDPSLRMRLIIELAKLVIPRPKEYEGHDSIEDGEKIIRRLFSPDK